MLETSHFLRLQIVLLVETVLSQSHFILLIFQSVGPKSEVKRILNSNVNILIFIMFAHIGKTEDSLIKLQAISALLKQSKIVIEILESMFLVLDMCG